MPDIELPSVPAEDVINISAPLSVEDALTLATRLHRLGQLESAQGIYQAVLDAHPDQPDALQFLGILSCQRGDKPAGLALLQRSVAAAPDLPGPQLNLGSLLIGEGRLDEAAACYERATALSSPNAELYSNLGVLRRHQGRLDEAEAAYRRAIEIDPNFHDAYSNLGRLLVQRKRVEEAVMLFYTAITLEPQSARTRRLLGVALGHLGRTAEARHVYEQWLADDPDNPLARHYLTACSPEAPPPRASDAFVQRTFDEYAGSFDLSLSRLTYRAPQIIGKVVAEALRPAAHSLDTLDAGCGTGLCAPHLKPWSRSLIGVDLSQRMLDKAAARGGYDTLVQAELTAYLASRSHAFDLIVSADTLCYFGDLSEVARSACNALREGGALLFTVEASADEAQDWQLHHHGRYSHARSYLQRVLTAAGFEAAVIADAELRMESGRPVAGYVVRTRRPAPAARWPAAAATHR